MRHPICFLLSFQKPAAVVTVVGCLVGWWVQTEYVQVQKPAAVVTPFSGQTMRQYCLVGWWILMTLALPSLSMNCFFRQGELFLVQLK